MHLGEPHETKLVAVSELTEHQAKERQGIHTQKTLTEAKPHTINQTVNIQTLKRRQ